MRTHRIKLLLGLAFWILCSQVLEAAPRNRRRARRNRAATAVQTYRVPATNYQAQPIANAQPPVVIAHTAAHPVYEPVQKIEEAGLQTVTAVAARKVSESSATTIQRLRVRTAPLEVGDPVPTVEENSSNAPVLLAASTKPALPSIPANAVPRYTVASSTMPPVTANPSTRVVATSSAIQEVNSLRARRGLPPFAEDPSLSAVAHRKAAIQASRGAMGHPGGSMGGARYEGVGMGPQFTSCYLYSNSGSYAGAATVVGRNGQRYHCLLIR